MPSKRKRGKTGARTRKPPKFSKMVLDRQRDAHALLSSIDSYKEDLAEALSRRHQPRLRPGETLPDYLLLLELTGRDVEAALDLLVDFDQTLHLRKADRFGLQVDRDQLLNRTAYQALGAVRRQIDGVFGREAGFRVHGMKGRTPRTAARIEVEIEGLLRLLKNPKVRYPEPRVSDFEHQRRHWLRLLSDPLDQLEHLRTRLLHLETEIRSLVVRRHRAMDEYDLVYVEAVRYLKAVMVMAREDVSMIKLLRPRYQRRRNAKRARENRQARAVAKEGQTPPPDPPPGRDEIVDETLEDERQRLQLVQRRRPGKGAA